MEKVREKEIQIETSNQVALEGTCIETTGGAGASEQIEWTGQERTRQRRQKRRKRGRGGRESKIKQREGRGKGAAPKDEKEGQKREQECG